MITEHKHTIIASNHDAATGSLASYTVGFVLSILFTLAAYVTASKQLLHGWSIVAAILGFGVVQLLIQLIFFLHMRRESKPRWNAMIFVFMSGILLIIVVGSLWIMHNLNYHMTPHQTDTYIQQEENIHR